MAAPVTAAIVAELSDRLRRRLDTVVAKAASWPVTVEGDAVLVQVDDSTQVRLTTVSGAVVTADAVVCTCLLAPACSHRAAVVSLAPVGDATDDTEESIVDSSERPVELSDVDIRTAESVHRAAADLIAAGISHSGAVARADLLRATHSASVAGLHRLARAGLSTLNWWDALRDGQSWFRREALVDAVTELLETAHHLRRNDGAWRGSARRPYHPVGSLRLHGICTRPVIGERGHVGAVTYLAGADGQVFTVATVRPGEPEMAARAGEISAELADVVVRHRDLATGGLIVSGAVASDDHRLGRPKRAALAPGSGWSGEPLAGLWRRPLNEQLELALRGERDSLVFVSATILGLADTGLVLAADGRQLVAVPANTQLRYAANLRRLAHTDRTIQLVARVLAHRPGHIQPYAVAVAGKDHWFDLGCDELPPFGPQQRRVDIEQSSSPDPTSVLRRWVDRAALGGRAVLLGEAARADIAQLRRWGLKIGADRLANLVENAQPVERDMFGRPVSSPVEGFAASWLAMAVYVRELRAELSRLAWLD